MSGLSEKPKSKKKPLILFFLTIVCLSIVQVFYSYWWGADRGRYNEYYRPQIESIMSEEGASQVEVDAFEFYGVKSSDFICIMSSRKFGAYKYGDLTDLAEQNISTWRVPNKNTESDYHHVFSFSSRWNRVHELHYIPRSSLLNESVNGCFSYPLTLTIRDRSDQSPWISYGFNK